MKPPSQFDPTRIVDAIAQAQSAEQRLLLFRSIPFAYRQQTLKLVVARLAVALTRPMAPPAQAAAWQTIPLEWSDAVHLARRNFLHASKRHIQ
jgi:hypothetical protein